jgi:glycosyltransferase involved in cell wall biosynthesis
MKIYKICIVTHKVLEGDGQGKVNYEVVKEALNRGYQVTLLASQIDRELEQNQLVTWINIPVRNLPTELLKNLVFSQKAATWLKQHYTEFDIVKTNGAITSFRSHLNAVHFVHSSWLKSPVHTWQQNKNLYGLYQLFYTAINSFWEKQAFAKAKRIVAVSATVKKELIDLGVSSEKIAVIINGVDSKEFTPGNSDRVYLGLPENVVLAFFAGDIRTPRKNLDTVLQALVKVPSLHLAIAGTTEGSPYPQLAANLKIDDRTHFLGYRTDIAALMQAMDMFVFPSRYEPFGIVISEAMASRLPVITCRNTGAAEIVTPECGIVLSNSEDEIGLTKALEKLSRDRYLRERMGKAGRAIAERHSWKSKAESYLQLFEELMAS